MEGAPGLVSDPAQGDIGLDVKWMPSADTVIDATLNPDFSQIESDSAQIGANERFALFFPEKRPFFLEGVELLSTPIQAVHTRTITSPRWGLRGTGNVGSAAYTALIAQDRGGGSVLLPGANSSDTADQDFSSWVAVGRVRQDIGRSFVSFLASDREVEGGGYNRVIGADFQWRPNARDTVAGQLLLSQSLTPDRPDLASQWDGRRLSGHAAAAWWYHSTRTIHWFAQYRDFADGFRADNSRVGTGATISISTALRPTDHLELELSENRRWLDVEPPAGGKARLFTAQIERLRATYTFTPKSFLRVIAQYVQTRRDPELYADEVEERSGGLGASVLVGYKLNWQTVLFLGYGDNRNLTEAGALEREDRQLFAKVSYAFQR